MNIGYIFSYVNVSLKFAKLFLIHSLEIGYAW